MGYQSPGTVGGKLLDGAENVKLFGEEIAVKAEILRIDSFSSHADEPHLLEWVKKASPAIRVFINHGEDAVTDKFAEEVSKATGKPAVAPYSGEVWDLAADELIHKAVIVPVIKKQTQSGNDDHRAASNASPVFKELRKTGDDLMKLIDTNREGANKDLKKMQKDIEEIIKKYSMQEDADGQ